jgi:hypothetical protein
MRSPDRKLAHVFTPILFLSCFAFGQSIPGLHLLDADANTGRPLLIQGVNSSEGETWEAPIELFGNASVEIFTGRSYMIAAVQLGYGQTGKYRVTLYSHYKNDSLCKRAMSQPEAAAKGAAATKVKAGSLEYSRETERECHLIRYKVLNLAVDTHANTLIVTSRISLDSHGSHLASTPSDRQWRSIGSLLNLNDDCSVKRCPDFESPYLKTAIQRATALADKEQEHFKRVYGGQ